MGRNKSGSKRDVYSDTSLPYKTRKVSNKPPSLIPKANRGKKNKQNQNQQKERNHKDQSRNRERQRKQQKRSMKLKAGSLKR